MSLVQQINDALAARHEAVRAIAVVGEKFSNTKHSRTKGGTYKKQQHDPLIALMTRKRSAVAPYTASWSVLDSGDQVGYVHKKPGGGFVGQRGDTKSAVFGSFASLDAAARAVVTRG